MGTNFYMTMQPPCSCCKRAYPEVHIGKRAGGWKFNLQALKDAEGEPISLANDQAGHSRLL